MKFHVPGLPHTLVSKDYCHCAYTQKVLNFKVMMEHLGHTVFVYESTAPLAPEDNLTLKWDTSDPLWVSQNAHMIDAIRKTIQPDDFLCIIGGVCQQPIANAFPQNRVVEFGIGYTGVFADYCVYESYFHMAYVYGRSYRANGRISDTVIPNYYDVADYPFGEHPQPYALFIGRLNEDKGIRVAARAAQMVGLPLVVAGQGATIPDGVDYRGRVGVEERGKLMAEASVLIAPSLYLEPFGGVVVEAQLCGTPVVTTDWGGFTETVVNGISGYRCSTMDEFVQALKTAPKLNRWAIRNRAVNTYSLNAVGHQYQSYFNRLNYLRDNGWEALKGS